MEFSASLSRHAFGDEDESRIKAIIGRNLWGKATKCNDYFLRSYRRGAKENKVFGSERLRADIDRQYVILALKIDKTGFQRENDSDSTCGGNVPSVPPL